MGYEFSVIEFANLLFGGVIGGAIGGVVGWKIGDAFAKRSSEQLETVYLVFARIAEERGLATFVRDKSGRITKGRVLSGDARVTLPPLQASGTGTVIRTEAKSTQTRE